MLCTPYGMVALSSLQLCAMGAPSYLWSYTSYYPPPIIFQLVPYIYKKSNTVVFECLPYFSGHLKLIFLGLFNSLDPCFLKFYLSFKFRFKMLSSECYFLPTSIFS